MSAFTCSSCHQTLRLRLHTHILALQQQRRSLNTSSVASRPQKGAHITSQYVDTIPPTASQLQAATHFFGAHIPTKFWTATEWRRHISQHSTSFGDIIPEVAFLGRSNSGKSSLLNALLDSPGLCRVGPKPGKTTTMHAWSLAPFSEGRSRSKRIDTEPKMTVLDMPGYGHGSRAEWGQEIIKYMRRRRQLRRAFLLLNPKHGVKASDEQILQVLRTEGIVHQIIACKCDDLKASEFTPRLEQLRETVTKSAVDQEARGLLLSDMLVVGNLGDGKANQRVETGNMKGVDDVRWAILQATGLDEYAAKQFADNLKSQQVRQPPRIIEPRLSSSNPQLAEQSVPI